MNKKTLIAATIITAFLISLAAGIQVKVAKAQTQPSVPEFSLKFVDNSYSYYMPPITTTTTDPYTGYINSTTQPGYTVNVENKSVIITIKNQPFAPSSGNMYLFIGVQMKGHYADIWSQPYHEDWFITEGSSQQNPTPKYYPSSGNMPQQSNSQYTVLNVSANYPSGSQLDFQVEALTGYDAQAYLGDSDHPLFPVHISYESVIGINQTSGWSNTQTITIPNTSTPSPTPSNSPSSTPTQQPTLTPTQTANPTVAPILGTNPIPLILGIVAVMIAVAAIAISLLVFFKRRGGKHG